MALTLTLTVTLTLIGTLIATFISTLTFTQVFPTDGIADPYPGTYYQSNPEIFIYPYVCPYFLPLFLATLAFNLTLWLGSIFLLIFIPDKSS